MKNDAAPSVHDLLAERGWLLGLARQLVGVDEAEDLVQDTFVVALERPPRTSASVRGWLITVARRLAHSRRRRASARREREGTRGRSTDGLEPDVAELAERTELESLLVHELLELREPFRATLLLRYRAGLNAADIARHQGVPAGTVRRRLKTGLDELRQQLDREAGGRHAWAALLLPADLVSAAPALPATSLLPLAPPLMKKVPSVAAIVLLATSATWLVGKSWSSRPRVDGAEAGAVGEMASSARASGAAASDAELGGVAISGGRTAQVAVASQRASYAVVDASGRAIEVEQAVLLGDAGARPLSLDAQGPYLDPAPDVGTARLVLWRRASWPLVVGVGTAPGAHRVVWGSESRVRGRLVRSGAALSEPVELTLVRDVGWAGALSADEAQSVEQVSSQTFTTRADGTFVLEGLGDDWRGWLELAPGWIFAGGDRASGVFTAQQGSLSLEVRRVPRVTGTLVDGSSGEPVPDSTVGILALLQQRARQHETVTDAQGRFSWPLPADLRSVRLQLGGEAGWRLVEQTIEDLPTEGERDLGIIALERGREVRLRVVDPQGRPVPDARVHELAVGPNRSVVTDDRGEAVLGLSDESDPAVVVSCEPWEKAKYAVDPLRADTQRLELRPGLRMTIEVVGGRGEPIPDALVRLELTMPVATSTFRWDQHAPRVSAGRLTGLGDGGDRVVLMMVEANDDGLVDIGGFARETFGTCTLEADAADPLRAVPIRSDREGHWQATLVHHGPAPATLRGRVLSPAGLPVQGAIVTFVPGGVDVLKRPVDETDAEGAFVLRIPADPEGGVLEVTARGFARWTEVLALERAMEGEQVCRLEPERSIRFRFVRPDGSDLADFTADIQQGKGVSRTVHRIARRGSEPFVLGGFGPGALDVLVEEQGLQRWFTVDEHVVEARIEVPAPARLALDVHQVPATDEAPARYTLMKAGSRELVRFGSLLASEPDGRHLEFVCPAGRLELWIDIDGQRWFASDEIEAAWGETLFVDLAR